MKKQNRLLNLCIIGLLWFSLAFVCKNGSQSSSSRRDSTVPVSRSTPSRTTTTTSRQSEESDDEDDTETDDADETTSARQNTDGRRTSVTTGTGDGAKYGARAPETCTDTSEPTGTRAAAENFKCHEEQVLAGKLKLVDNPVVSEMSSPRMYDHIHDLEAWGIDATQDVTPISGSYDEYTCSEVSDYMQNRGKNCVLHHYRNAEGICYKKSSGEWVCIMQDNTDNLDLGISDQAPPR